MTTCLSSCMHMHLLPKAPGACTPLPEPFVFITTCYQPKPRGSPQPPDDDKAPLCFSTSCGSTHMYADKMVWSKKKKEENSYLLL